MTEPAQLEHTDREQTVTPAAIRALLADIAVARQKFESLAQAIAAEWYDWRPVEGVRSVAEVLKHVAAHNYFLPALTGAAAPAATGIDAGSVESVRAYEARSLSQEETIAELHASFMHLERTMRALDEARLSEPVQVFGQSMPALDLLVLTTSHLHENLGLLIGYARSNRVVPSWSG
jgi:uncharacterized damage-inducible protein DinB